MPFFGNVGFVKFGTFSALLALPVMIREGYGQIVYETLPHILLSNASLVTKSCIARFVECDAFNPSALSDCSTGPSPPMAHAKSTLSPSQASAGCPRAGLFCRFRSICEETRDAPDKLSGRIIRPDSLFFHYPVSGRITCIIRPDSRIIHSCNIFVTTGRFPANPSCLLLLRRV